MLSARPRLVCLKILVTKFLLILNTRTHLLKVSVSAPRGDQAWIFDGPCHWSRSGEYFSSFFCDTVVLKSTISLVRSIMLRLISSTLDRSNDDFWNHSSLGRRGTYKRYKGFAPEVRKLGWISGDHLHFYPSITFYEQVGSYRTFRSPGV